MPHISIRFINIVVSSCLDFQVTTVCSNSTSTCKNTALFLFSQRIRIAKCLRKTSPSAVFVVVVLPTYCCSSDSGTFRKQARPMARTIAAFPKCMAFPAINSPLLESNVCSGVHSIFCDSSGNVGQPSAVSFSPGVMIVQEDLLR